MMKIKVHIYFIGVAEGWRRLDTPGIIILEESPCFGHIWQYKDKNGLLSRLQTEFRSSNHSNHRRLAAAGYRTTSRLNIDNVAFFNASASQGSGHRSRAVICHIDCHAGSNEE